MSDADADADQFGRLERTDALPVLHYERRLAHSQEMVWRALTEDDNLAAWFPTTMEGERRPGAPLHFSFRRTEGAPFDGEMLDFVPPSLMELRWAEDVLRFELEPDGTGCILSLRVTFPEYGKAARDAAGWHVCLDRLAERSEGAPSGGSRSSLLTAGRLSIAPTWSASGPRRPPSARRRRRQRRHRRRSNRREVVPVSPARRAGADRGVRGE